MAIFKRAQWPVTRQPGFANAFPSRPPSGLNYNAATAHNTSMAAQASRVPRLASLLTVHTIAGTPKRKR